MQTDYESKAMFFQNRGSFIRPCVFDIWEKHKGSQGYNGKSKRALYFGISKLVMVSQNI